MVQYRMVLQSIVPKTEYDGTGLTVVLRFWLAKCAGVWGSGRLLSTDSGCKPPSEPSKPNPEDREISRLRSPALQREKAPLSQNLQALFVSAYQKMCLNNSGVSPFPRTPGRDFGGQWAPPLLCSSVSAGFKGFGVLWFFSVHKRHSKLCLQLTVWGRKEG